jgi:hypothetical protein
MRLANKLPIRIRLAYPYPYAQAHILLIITRITLFGTTPLETVLQPLWHAANKNIQQHCRAKFSTIEVYNDFFRGMATHSTVS